MKGAFFSAGLVAFGCLAVSCRTIPTSIGSESFRPFHMQLAGVVDHPKLTEVSGMAPSQYHPARLWVLNDSGHDPILYAIGTDGANQGSFIVGGSENRDWEDLASYRKNGVSWLVVGEMGDNHARHSLCRLLFLQEPVPVRGIFPEVVNPARVLEFRYEDGPRDAEGLAVDPMAEKIFLLSKRTEPPVLYELPLEPERPREIQTARRIAAAAGIEAPSLPIQMAAPLKSRFSSMPTAMDWSADGRRALIMTYSDLYLYAPAELKAGKRPFARKGLPRLRQAEAACFSTDGSLVYFTSEKRPAPLYRMVLPN